MPQELVEKRAEAPSEALPDVFGAKVYATYSICIDRRICFSTSS
jgi:hypothetical protein